MDWWQAVLLAAVPAAIASAALLLQQQSSNRLERVKIADMTNEREHQRQLAVEARSAERERAEAEQAWRLASDWRFERREAHVRLLNLMHEAHEDFYGVGLADVLAERESHAPRVADDQFGRDWGTLLSEARAAVQIISSGSSAKAAEGAASALTRMYYSLTSDRLELRAREKLVELHSRYHDCRSQYIEMARAELAELHPRGD